MDYADIQGIIASALKEGQANWLRVTPANEVTVDVTAATQCVLSGLSDAGYLIFAGRAKGSQNIATWNLSLEEIRAVLNDTGYDVVEIRKP